MPGSFDQQLLLWVKNERSGKDWKVMTCFLPDPHVDFFIPKCEGNASEIIAVSGISMCI